MACTACSVAGRRAHPCASAGTYSTGGEQPPTDDATLETRRQAGGSQRTSRLPRGSNRGSMRVVTLARPDAHSPDPLPKRQEAAVSWASASILQKKGESKCLHDTHGGRCLPLRARVQTGA